MNAYMYRAALWCAACARQEIDLLSCDLKKDTGDSDDWPQGPYSDGGGEADSPQHCDRCGIFLKNPLTPEGAQYVREAIAEHKATGRGARHTLQEWANFYGIAWSEA